jgi:hypothetical protein
LPRSLWRGTISWSALGDSGGDCNAYDEIRSSRGRPRAGLGRGSGLVRHPGVGGQGLHLQREGQRPPRQEAQHPDLLHVAEEHLGAAHGAVQHHRHPARLPASRGDQDQQRRGTAPRRDAPLRDGGPAGEERHLPDRGPPAHVPDRVGRRRGLSQRADGHQPYRGRLYQGRQAQKPRQSAQRGIPRPRHVRGPDQRALPDAELHPRHPAARADGRGSTAAPSGSIRASSSSTTTTTRRSSGPASRWSS